jgi:leader peptidase (prepilin peptidase)/N-methyltransferase
MFETISGFLTIVPFWMLTIWLSVLGAVWGSFVSALCSRWPAGQSIATGRSRCDSCDRQIATHDLIPVLSFLLLKGKCRYCGQGIGRLPLATELVSILIGIFPLALLPQDQAVGLALLAWLLLPLVLLDWLHLWLPDRLVLLLAATGLLLGPLLDPEISLVDRGIGLSAGFLSLQAIRYFYKKYRNIDGMGAGDPKLFGALGAWLGWQALPITLLTASCVGLVIILLTYRSKNPEENAFPLGSYLGIGAYLVAILT